MSTGLAVRTHLGPLQWDPPKHAHTYRAELKPDTRNRAPPRNWVGSSARGKLKIRYQLTACNVPVRPAHHGVRRGLLSGTSFLLSQLYTVPTSQPNFAAMS